MTTPHTTLQSYTCVHNFYKTFRKLTRTMQDDTTLNQHLAQFENPHTSWHNLTNTPFFSKLYKQSTQLYTTWHTLTKLHKQLYNTFNSLQYFYTTLQKVYTTLHKFIKLYTTLHNSTKLYTTLDNSTRLYTRTLYTTLQNSTQLKHN